MRNKIILIITMVLLLLPVYLMIIGGFQDVRGVMRMPPKLYPTNPTLENYRILSGYPLARWILNSIIVVLATAIISVLVSASAGFVFSAYEFRLKKPLWMLYLIGIMIPRITLYIPHYIIIKYLGISGTLLAVILPVCFNPIGLYLARNYFNTVPKSLIESARIDGATELQILKHIIIPISKPIITALALFSAIGSLGDYVWQSLVLQAPERQTLLVGLMRTITNFAQTPEGRINPLGRSMAIGTILFIPLLIIFLTANKYFTTALGGAVKE